MADATSPLSDVCLCGSSDWHAMIGDVVWCARCGCVRPRLNRYWRVPLDRAGEISWTNTVEDGGESGEPSTKPGTPAAKKKEGH